MQQRLLRLAGSLYFHVAVDDPHVAPVLVVDRQLNAHTRPDVAEYILITVPHEVVGTDTLRKESTFLFPVMIDKKFFIYDNYSVFVSR